METEPFDEADLLLPASPAPLPTLKRLKKASVAAPPSPPPPAETLTPDPLSPPNPGTSPPNAAAAEAASEVTDTDDGLEPLFPEPGELGRWETQEVPMEEEEDDEEGIGGGGLIEELRKEKSAKRRLNLDAGDGEEAAASEANGKRSKRNKKEAWSDVASGGGGTKESAREKKRFEKERRVHLDIIHAESQRLLRETRGASFKPIQTVQKPISSVLEKIRLRKLEILKISSAPHETDSSSEPMEDSAGPPDDLGVPDVGRDDTGSKMNDVAHEVSMDGSDLAQHDRTAEDEDSLNCGNNLNQCNSEARNEDIFDNSHDSNRDNTWPNGGSTDTTKVAPSPLVPSSSPTRSSGEVSSSEEDNDKENIDPSTQNKESINPCPRRVLDGDSCPDDALLKDFVDDEAEEEDDSDNDLMRFKENEEDDESDEDEVFNDLIATGYEEGAVDHKKRNELHQEWLELQDEAVTNNVLERLKLGQQQQKESIIQDDDDSEDYEDDSGDEMSYDLTPRNVVRQNSEKAKKMVAQMFTDNDTYVPSDDEETEEFLVRQRISKEEVNMTFKSPLEDEHSREVFGLIKKLNIAPQPKRRGKQATSNFEMLMVGGNNNSSSMSSFLGRTTSCTLPSSHKPTTHRPFIFGRDDSNSRSCLPPVECISDRDQTDINQSRKTTKLTSSQLKPVASRTNSESDISSAGASLFEVLRRSSLSFDKQLEYENQKSSHIPTETQVACQFSAFKSARMFSRVGARD